MNYKNLKNIYDVKRHLRPYRLNHRIKQFLNEAILEIAEIDSLYIGKEAAIDNAGPFDLKMTGVKDMRSPLLFSDKDSYFVDIGEEINFDTITIFKTNFNPYIRRFMEIAAITNRIFAYEAISNSCKTLKPIKFNDNFNYDGLHYHPVSAIKRYNHNDNNTSFLKILKDFRDFYDISEFGCTSFFNYKLNIINKCILKMDVDKTFFLLDNKIEYVIDECTTIVYNLSFEPLTIKRTEITDNHRPFLVFDIFKFVDEYITLNTYIKVKENLK